VSSYLINDSVAVDAGCLGFWRTPQEQEAVKHVFLTHSHTDHVASLPIFVENAWTPAGDCPTIYGSSETLEDMQKHIFNDRVWPDFIALSRTMPPFLQTVQLQPEVPVRAGELTVIPVPVNHLVPTFGFVVSDREGAVIIGGDSGPTERLWEIARETPGLRAVFMEACFPNSMSRLAEVSLHLTPQMVAGEAAKLPSATRIIAVHIKVRYRDQVVHELADLQLPGLEVGECEKEYFF
jgi:ribonuclease BN (tRNA processing enzyme)